MGGYLTVIRWTVNNPGGLPVHYGVVHYGRDPNNLNQTAKNPIRLNPNPFIDRVPREPVRPPAEDDHYYTVKSMDSRQEPRNHQLDRNLHYTIAERSRKTTSGIRPYRSH